ncbi:DP13A protein, partial [Polypterus senegalus]
MPDAWGSDPAWDALEDRKRAYAHLRPRGGNHPCCYGDHGYRALKLDPVGARGHRQGVPRCLGSPGPQHFRHTQKCWGEDMQGHLECFRVCSRHFCHTGECRQSHLKTTRKSSSGSLVTGPSTPDSAALSALSLDSLVAPDTPIQFDIISPVSEEYAGQGKAQGQTGRRTNPFGESGVNKSEDSEGSILHQLYIVRFLGSMEVRSHDSVDVIYETMRQILAARAIHNIFRMTESHLLVTCDCLNSASFPPNQSFFSLSIANFLSEYELVFLAGFSLYIRRLIDPQTQVTRLRFPLQNVVLCTTHQENKRLFGFVLRVAGSGNDGRPISVCYVFESNNEGEKMCDSVGLAKQIAFHSEMDRRELEKQKEKDKEKERQQEELSKQKQIEKDLEEQSRLIAASTRPNQTGGDGQVLVLGSSQSEDSDAGDESKKKGESEA